VCAISTCRPTLTRNARIAVQRRADFEIKALPAGKPVGNGGAAASSACRPQPAGRPVVHISVTAGRSASVQHHVPHSHDVSGFQRTSSAPIAAQEAADAVRKDSGGASAVLRPLPGYRSMAQFGAAMELYRSRQAGWLCL
jgi:hypothetical protein